MRSDPEIHYLDNAATTIPAPEVTTAIKTSLREDWANPSSLYTPGAKTEERLNLARSVVAKTLGCTPAEVYFTGCGSESNNIAILGAAAARKGWGNRVVVSGFEHPSVSGPVQRLEEAGFEVIRVNPDRDGHLSVDAMLQQVTKGTVLVACMAVNNETGAQVDIARLAAGVKVLNPRTAVHVDGVQAWLRVPLKLDDVDSLSVSGHKIHGPKGVGALYLRKGFHILPPYLGGGQEKGIRPGTENTPYILGMALAAQSGAKQLRQKHTQMEMLNEQLRAGLAYIPDVRINSPEDAVPEVLNFSLNTIKSENMLHFLEQRKVFVSSGSACSKGAASHTLSAMGCDERTIDTAIRVSFCADNTPEDVEALLRGLSEGYRKIAHRN